MLVDYRQSSFNKPEIQTIKKINKHHMNEFMIKLSYEIWDSLVYSSDVDSLIYSSDVDSLI